MRDPFVTTHDPFNPVPEGETLASLAVSKPSGVMRTPTALSVRDIYYNEINAQGNVCKYKIESGVPVKVADLGNIKNFFNQAIMKAALMTPDEIALSDFGDMTHIEIAAIKLAAYAAAGDLKATQELFDRVLGRAKQVSESTNLNLTIDDILSGVNPGEGTIDV